MFVWKSRYRDLQSRLEHLEEQLEAQSLHLAQESARWRSSTADAIAELTARFEVSPEQRVQYLLSAIADDLSAALQRSLADAQEASALKERILRLYQELAQLVDGGGSRQPRTVARLNQVYHAPQTGYVALFFVGGRTDSIELLMGPTNPPEICVSQLDCGAGINSYAGGVVRKGEYWLAESARGEGSGVRCCYTPIF